MQEEEGWTSQGSSLRTTEEEGEDGQRDKQGGGGAETTMSLRGGKGHPGRRTKKTQRGMTANEYPRQTTRIE